MTASVAGISCVEVASRFVQNSRPASPSTGGTSGSEPVATTSRSYGISSPSTATTPGRATCASPRTSRARRLSSQGSWPESSQSLVIQSRHSQTPSACGRSGASPGARSSDEESSAARSIVFVGMHA